MKKLEVKFLSNGCEIVAPVSMMTDEEFAEFHEIAAAFLTAAFADRHLCLVGDEQRVSDWSYATSKMPQREIIVRAEKFLTLFAFSPAIDFFRQVVASSEFHWDALLFAPLEERKTDEITELIKKFDATDFFDLPAEVITSFGDGYGLLWLNPPQTSENVFERLSAIAKPFDWTVEKSDL